MKPRDESLHDLSERYLRGDLNADELAAFERRLLKDDAARAEFRRATRLDANLRTLATERQDDVVAWSANRAPVGDGSGVSWTALFWRRLAPVAAVLVVAAILLWKQQATAPQQAGVRAPAEQSAAGFAVVTAQADTRWAGGRKLATGDLLARESLHLESGIAQIELFSGVTVVVEGEAEFEIVSPMEMAVTRGRVSARVPEPAHGFRIHTAEGEVVDLGTEFALDVGRSNSEVHVLDGEVEWHPRAAAMHRMAKGEALRWDADGNGTTLAANARGFVGMAELSQKLFAARKSRREDWVRFRETLRHDPRLVAYYQMGAADSWNRRLPNQSLVGADTVHDGAIVAATRVADRWGTPGGALDFSSIGSRVRVNVPGEFRSITLLTWVKINSLDRWYNSLFLTDGHELHEPHWQIMEDGRLFFSVKNRDQWDAKKGEKDKHIFYSPPFWNRSLSGQWLMIATTYDVDARMVTHFLNGRILSQEAVPEEYLVETVSIGAASLCNWSEPMYRKDAAFTIRNLNGSMDEFSLFGAALTPREIADIYEHGKP